jgi:hypothetical protein
LRLASRLLWRVAMKKTTRPDRALSLLRNTLRALSTDQLAHDVRGGLTFFCGDTSRFGYDCTSRDICHEK